MTTAAIIGGFGDLLPVARSTLGADAVAVLLEGRLVDHAGLTPDEEERLSADPETFAQEFASVAGCRILLEGTEIGSLLALQRGLAPFENADHLSVFVTHIAIAVGLRSRELDDAEIALPPDLDRLVLSVHDLKELSAAVDAIIGPLFGGANAGLMVVDLERNTLQLARGGFGGVDDAVADSVRDKADQARSTSSRVYSTGHPYISNLATRDPGIRADYARALRARNLLTLPLPHVGVLHICNKPEPFDVDDVRRALALAPRVASMVELAMTLLSLRREQQLEHVLADFAVQVARGIPLEAFAGVAMCDLGAAIDTSMLAIVADDAEPVLARRGRERPELELRVLDASGDGTEIRTSLFDPLTLGDEGWAACWVPVRLGEDRLGTLVALRGRGEPFTAAEQRALSRLADLVALARAAERYRRQRDALARLRERERIADDLHDHVAQVLYAAQLSVDASLRCADLASGTRNTLEHVRGLLVSGDAAIREVIEGLETSTQLAELGTPLRSVAAEVAGRFGTAIDVTLQPAVEQLRLDPDINDALVRVAREGLVNASKHAQASRISLSARVTPTGRVVVTVADDGRGLDKGDDPARHGLRSMRRTMRRHGGALRVHRSSNGTRVSASVRTQLQI